MKNKKTVLAAALAAALALSVVTVSAAAISANEAKPPSPTFPSVRLPANSRLRALLKACVH